MTTNLIGILIMILFNINSFCVIFFRGKTQRISSTLLMGIVLFLNLSELVLKIITLTTIPINSCIKLIIAALCFDISKYKESLTTVEEV